jgi:hypothetical protein
LNTQASLREKACQRKKGGNKRLTYCSGM